MNEATKEMIKGLVGIVDKEVVEEILKTLDGVLPLISKRYAKVCGDLKKALIEEGFTEQQAMDLVLSTRYELISKMSKG